MCGIIGIVSVKPVALRLVEALRRLEYRGYDSAGVALLKTGGVQRIRAPGKLANLENSGQCSKAGRIRRDRPHTLGDPWRS